MHAKFVCLALAFCLAAPCFVSADKDKDKKDNKKDNKKSPPKSDPPPFTDKQMDAWELAQRNLAMNQMRARFASMDTSRDDFLDEPELAIAFRGKNAKPPMPPAPSSETPPAKTPPDTKKYPDQEFLLALDDNNDRKVSLAEYLEWAEDYALSYSRAARQAEETRIRIVDLQLKAAQAASAAQRQAIENQLNQQRIALAKQQANLKDRKDNPNDHRHDRKKKDNKK